MTELAHFFSQATLDEILLFLFVATGAGFIKTLLFLGKTLKSEYTKEMSAQRQMVTELVKKLESVFGKLDIRLEKIEGKLESINTTLTAELNSQDKRIALIEHDMQFVAERRKDVRRDQQ